MDFFEGISLSHWTWFILALVLLGLEMAMPGVVFLWMAIASAIVGGIVFFMPQISWEMQFIIFAVLSIVSVFMGRTFLTRNPIETSDTNLNKRADQFVGHNFVLLSDMMNGQGKVHIGDTNWSVEGDFEAKAGEKVRVVGVDVTILKVEKL